MSDQDDRIPEYTAADALNDALVQAGVSYIFLNSGTDYPAIIESWAKSEALGRSKPEIIISPHETVAISAAQGFAQVTGRPQAVFVHVDVGTQNLGGALHNAYRCRTPVFILAGLSPYTIEGEQKGSRSAFIQFIQNAEDQAGIVRGYTKMNCELKSGKNTQQMVYRALQIADSEPKGPVYIMATREALAEEGRESNARLDLWSPIAPLGLDGESVNLLADALAHAQNPLIITSYLGRNPEAVSELVDLCERLAIRVVEANPVYMNFPTDHPLHCGNTAQPLLKDADLILVIDCDLPWMPASAKLREDCRVFYLDIDPLKESIPVWYIPSERFMKADSCTALRQLNTCFAPKATSLDEALVVERYDRAERQLATRLEQRTAARQQQPQITAEYLSACVQEVIDEDTLLLCEAITSTNAIIKQIPRSKPGTFFDSGGSSLGWFGGAAIGMKLADPKKDVVALVSDGVYIFSCPTAVYWMARRYQTPFLTVIYNNQGWNAPRVATKGQHPDGYAVKANSFWSSFDPPARLDLVAEAAGGAFARTVEAPEDLLPALQEGRAAVKAGRPAVINVLLPPV
ncbi:MAG: thiamine pyrophosphate-requiring protein [Coriobacteriia bacterium]|nr:thiamine pyrophosphate-requiring protein [Coriobacteriia bacterium]